MGHPDMQYSRVLFTIPNPQQNVFHNGITEDALNLYTPIFCQDVLTAVEQWYEAQRNDPNVIANLPRLVQYREHGLTPYMVGVPLIA